MSNLMTAASPPRFVSIEQFMNAANTAQNMALAHEISVNQNFKLEKVEYQANSLEKQIHDTVHKVFWDTLKDDLAKSPPDYKHILVLLAEAKQILASLLLPNHTKIKDQIDNIMDMELIMQQIDKETFDYVPYASFICDMMSKLCAPVRDDAIEKIRALSDPIDTFRAIMEMLELLKLDMANFTIAQMRPYLQQQVVAYEQKKFREFVELQREAGIDGLEATKQWLARALKRITGNETIGGFRYESGATASSITNEAFMEIFKWSAELNFPETLSMDEVRFNEVYVKFRKFLVVCTIVNTIYGLLGETIRGLSELRDNLKKNILVFLDDYMKHTFEEMMLSIGEEVIRLTNDALLKIDKKPLDDVQVKTIKTLIVDLSSKNLHENSVYKLLFARYIEFLQGILTKRTQGPVKIPHGMSTMEKDLIEMTGQFLRLVTFNKNVFGTYYGEMIQEINELGGTDATGVAQ